MYSGECIVKWSNQINIKKIITGKINRHECVIHRHSHQNSRAGLSIFFAIASNNPQKPRENHNLRVREKRGWLGEVRGKFRLLWPKYTSFTDSEVKCAPYRTAKITAPRKMK